MIPVAASLTLTSATSGWPAVRTSSPGSVEPFLASWISQASPDVALGRPGVRLRRLRISASMSAGRPSRSRRYGGMNWHVMTSNLPQATDSHKARRRSDQPFSTPANRSIASSVAASAPALNAPMSMKPWIIPS